MEKIGLGGGCHWCTEAIFQSLRGVLRVQQGWISAIRAPAYSEAVIVHFDPGIISLATLVAVHLHTHSATSDHGMRHKYRSGVYAFDETQQSEVARLLEGYQADFAAPLVTKAYGFRAFRENTEEFTNYYYRNPGKPFCQNWISPKLQLLMDRFGSSVDPQKINENAT